MLEFVDGKLWIKLTSPEPKKGLGNDPLAQRFRRIFDNVRNYDGSWTEYGNAVGVPIANPAGTVWGGR